MNDLQTIVWVHGDCLRPDNPALLARPGTPSVFVFDDALLKRYAVSLKRIVFLYECLLELPVTIRRGNVAAELLKFASEHRADEIVTTTSPSPHFAEICTAVEGQVKVTVWSEPPFLDTDGELDLKRFSRYWRVAQRYAFG